jgi:hypothetical protein
MATVLALHPLHYFYQFGMSKDETKSTPNMENRSLILGVLFYEVATILWFFLSSLHFFGDAAS